MAFGLTADGFVAKTAEDLQSEIEADQRGAAGADLDTSAESPVGQLNAPVITKLAELWALAKATYDAKDPGAAGGAQLDAVCALTGTRRDPKTKGRVTLTLTVAALSTVAAGAVAQVDGEPTNRWVTLEDAVNATGSSAPVAARAEAQTAGRIRANAGQISVIATPVAGWTSVTNALDAAAGTDDEADPALRLRREAELSRPGKSTVAAIRADLLDLEDDDGDALLVACVVKENPSSFPDGEGRPPHSVEAIVQFAPGLAGADLDAARLAVGQQLFDSKAGGIDTHGSQAASALDPEGDPQQVLFSEPGEVDLYVEVSLATDPDTYAGDAAVEDAILAFGAALTLGADVVWARLLCAVLDVAGVTDVTALVIGTAASLLQPSNVAIGPRDVAVFDSSRITVAS